MTRPRTDHCTVWYEPSPFHGTAPRNHNHIRNHSSLRWVCIITSVWEAQREGPHAVLSIYSQCIDGLLGAPSLEMPGCQRRCSSESLDSNMQLQAYRLSLFFCTRRRYRRVNGVAEREKKKGDRHPGSPRLAWTASSTPGEQIRSRCRSLRPVTHSTIRSRAALPVIQRDLQNRFCQIRRASSFSFVSRFKRLYVIGSSPNA